MWHLVEDGNFTGDYVSYSREICVVDNSFYISISSDSRIKNQVVISLQNLYRTQITQVRARKEFVVKMYDFSPIFLYLIEVTFISPLLCLKFIKFTIYFGYWHSRNHQALCSSFLVFFYFIKHFVITYNISWGIEFWENMHKNAVWFSILIMQVIIQN